MDRNSNSSEKAEPLALSTGGKLIVLTAPLTEIIDHAGFFIQMAMASMPVWMIGDRSKKYPKWRDLARNPDRLAWSMPAGVRILEESLLRCFPPDDVIAAYPDDLDEFVGPDSTRVVGVPPTIPSGVTFAAGVYASVFGTSKNPASIPITPNSFSGNSLDSPWRKNFKVIVGGSGA